MCIGQPGVEGPDRNFHRKRNGKSPEGNGLDRADRHSHKSAGVIVPLRNDILKIIRLE